MSSFKIRKSRKKNPSENYIVASGYPQIDDALEETLGEMPYQEDIMRLFASVTGVTFGEADNVRRIVGKKYDLSNPKEAAVILSTKQKWLDGCLKNGIPDDVAETYWQKIMANAGYSFNKSHAVAYSVITYETLWYYHKFPANFIAARLNTNPEEISFWVIKAQEKGVEFVVPSVNHSGINYVAKGNRIYMPLSSIKGLGINAQNAIIDSRPFTTYEDFITRINRRVVNKTIVTNLFLIGALDDMTGNFEDLQTGNKIERIGKEIIVTDSKKNEKRYKNLAYELGVWIMPPPLALEVRKYSGYESGFVTDISYGLTNKGKKRVEVFINDSKYPTFYIGDWEVDRYPSLENGMFLVFKRRLDYNRYLTDLIDLTYLV